MDGLQTHWDVKPIVSEGLYRELCRQWLISHRPHYSIHISVPDILLGLLDTLNIGPIGCTETLHYVPETNLNISVTSKLVTSSACQLKFASTVGQIYKESDNSKMSHPRCVYINTRCRYQSIKQQSIKQQYLKRCLIKDDNYMFRPIALLPYFRMKAWWWPQ